MKEKKTFYCVQVEFYNNGQGKIQIIERTCATKPVNQFKQTPIGLFWHNWFDTRQQAEAHLSRQAA